MLRLSLVLGALFFQAANAEITTTWITPDFKIVKTDSKRPMAKLTTDCRAQIAKAVCLVDPPGKDPEVRPCLSGGEAYIPTFEALYDRFPAHLQKMFCSLDRIFVEKQFEATAYAGLNHDGNGNITGAQMGMRKDFLDQMFSIDLWSSWKEQLNFGGDPNKYVLDPNLPMIYSSSQDMLYYVVAHEFGHMFDFTNKVNSWDDCKFENDTLVGTCVATPGSWSDLGWTSRRDETKAGNDFSLRKSLCFYWCNGTFIDPSRAGELYQGLFATNFIGIYAASNPSDDWAETLAYYTLYHELGATYEITLGDGTRFDAMAHLNSALMAPKIAYLEKLFRDGIKYPGQ